MPETTSIVGTPAYLAPEMTTPGARLELRELPVEDATDAEALALFHEARFGFSEARRQWPEGAAAAAGLHDAVVAMAHRELDRGRGDAARLLVEELADVPDDLRQRLEEQKSAHATLQTRAARTDALERERDWRVERRARAFTSYAFTSYAFASFWIVPWLLLSWGRRRGIEPTTSMVAWWHLSVLVAPAVAFLLFPQPFLSTQLNRRLASLTVIALLGAQGIWSISAVAGVPIVAVLPLVHGSGAAAFATLTTQDRAYLWGSLGQAAGAAVTLLVSEHVLEASMIMHVLSLVAPGIALHRAPPPPSEAPKRPSSST